MSIWLIIILAIIVIGAIVGFFASENEQPGDRAAGAIGGAIWGIEGFFGLLHIIVMLSLPLIIIICIIAGIANAF